MDDTNYTNDALFTGLQSALTFKFNQDDPNEVAIVDMLWLKLYQHCRKEKDVELAFLAATSINNESKRETALGSLIEQLVDEDSLSKLFKCRLSNKNLILTTDYLKARLKECLNKVLENTPGEDLNSFKADKIFLKLLKALHSLYTFYTKPRESCQYMLSIVLQIKDYKFASHSKIIPLLEIEQHLLSLILLVTRSFDNSSKYIFYIKENDYYSILKRKSDNDDDLTEVSETLSHKMLGRVFAINTDEGKYIIKLKDLEAIFARNEAQLTIIDKCGEYIDELEDLIDFCVYFNLFDLAIHLCVISNHDPSSVVHQMTFQYCEKHGQVNQAEGSDDGIVTPYKFEDAHYAWEIDELDVQRTETDTLLRLICDTVTCLKEEYPNLRTQAYKVLTANIKDVSDLDRKLVDQLIEGLPIEDAEDLLDV